MLRHCLRTRKYRLTFFSRAIHLSGEVGNFYDHSRLPLNSKSYSTEYELNLHARTSTG
jgi:hypothetical protein